jgi:RNA polymerase sigma factor (sigma-70 family)
MSRDRADPSPTVRAEAAAPLQRYRAERLLRRDFAGLRSRVLAVVRSRLRATGLALDQSDLEACYATAWHGLYGAVLEGQRVEDPAAWLVVVTFRRAIDEGRARTRQLADAHSRLDEPLGAVASASDFAGLLDDRGQLKRLFQALHARLSRRERQAVALCYLQGLSRAEAAARMGISRARMRKLMDGTGERRGVASIFAELAATVGAGAWCEQQGDSLIRAYAFGVLDPDGERHRLALAHMRECPACRARVVCLRGLAGVLGPLPLRLSGALSRTRRRARARRRVRPRRQAPERPGAHGRAGSLGARAGVRAVGAKLATLGAVAVVLGGGAAVLVSGAPGAKSRSGHALRAEPSPRTARSLPRATRSPRAAGSSPQTARSSPQATRSTRPGAHVPSHRLTASPRPTSQESPTSAPSAERLAGEFAPERPASEFTPERARR